MLLFLTRDAFCRRSMEERRTGEGDPVRVSRLFSELKRVCQKTRGEVALSMGDMGDDWKGEESVFRGDILDCSWEVSMMVRMQVQPASGGQGDMRHAWSKEKMMELVPGSSGYMYWLTFACAWLEPGEFLLCSVGEISDSGRGIALCVLDGIGIVLLLERRRGCT